MSVLDVQGLKTHFFTRGGVLKAVDFWPLPGEAPFPEGQTASGLQDLITDKAKSGSDE